MEKNSCNICKKHIDKSDIDTGFISGAWVRPQLALKKRILVCQDCASELIDKMVANNKGWKRDGILKETINYKDTPIWHDDLRHEEQHVCPKCNVVLCRSFTTKKYTCEECGTVYEEE